jgi:predicted permease
VTQVFPILLIFLSGYIFKRFHKDSSKDLIDLVLYFIFPIFIIYKIHFLEFNAEIYKVAIFAFIAFIIGVGFAIIFSKIFKINANSAAMIAMSVAYGNTSFLGFAFVDSFYGSYALSLAIFYDQVNMLLLALFSPIICSFGSKEKRFSLKVVVRSIVTFPPTIAFVIAIATKFLVFPEVLTLFLEKISMILVPIVMFAVGMKFNLSSIKGKEKEITIILLISMVLIPLSLYLIALPFFEITMAIKVSILEAAMPPMVLATVIAINSGLDEELGMGSLGVGMLLSFATIPYIVSLIG